MKNKTLAILGIASYLLSVISSATDSEGNFTSSEFLIFISGTLLLFFVVTASIRLWKQEQNLSITFITSFLIRSIFEILLINSLVVDGSSIILIYTLSKITFMISSVVVIVKLFKNKDSHKETEK